jgi:Protein of unknown function (DUF2452)
MRKKNEKPDSVVWDEEKGYYQGSLTYGSNVGAPAIKLDDVQSWKRNQANNVNKQFNKKYEELKEEFKKLVDEVNWNEIVYSSEYSFIPIIGETYHLYIRDNQTTFLSLIDPNSWNKKYIGSFRLESTQKWVKV